MTGQLAIMRRNNQVDRKAGLRYSVIRSVYLPPADARAAFESGSVDAWAIWDPFLTVARVATKARTLIDGTGLVANREFFLGDRKFVEAHLNLIPKKLDVREATLSGK
jgi:sulfonate transport system substrate-binding protein